MKCWF